MIFPDKRKYKIFFASSQQICLTRNGKGSSSGEREMIPGRNVYHQEEKIHIINGKYVGKLQNMRRISGF